MSRISIQINQFIYIIFLFFFLIENSFSQCNLSVDAGPDVYLCPDESGILYGSATGDYEELFWTPEFGLADPFSLETEVFSPGIYTLIARYKSDVNLIQNGDFSQGVAGFTSQYLQSTSANPVLCPTAPWGPLSCEGTYNVLDNPQSGHSSFAACSDQSGDGNMMVVNGAATANEQVWCQTIAVNPNTDYEFFAWVTNVVSSSPAILQFFANGQFLGGTFSPGGVCEWEEFSTTWNSGGAVSVQFCIINQNTAAGGNDFAIDNIQLYEICEGRDEVEVHQVELRFDLEEPEALTCKDSIRIITPQNLEGRGINYSGSWSTFDGNIVSQLMVYPFSATIDAPGEYIFTYVFDNGIAICEVEETIVVEEDRPDIFAEAEPEDFLGCSPSTTFVRAVGSSFDEDYQFYWYTFNGNILNGQFTDQIEVSETGEYFLVATDTLSGCSDTTIAIVLASPDIPDAQVLPADTLNCLNTSILLDGSNSTLPPTGLLRWIDENGNILNQDSLNHMVDSAGTYTLIIENPENNCIDSFEINVFGYQNQPFVQLPERDTLTCEKESIYLQLNAQMSESYRWETPIGPILDTNALEITLPGNYVVQATHLLSGCSIWDTLEVIALQDYPTVELPISILLNCKTPQNTIVASNIESTGPYTINWTTNNGNIIGATDTSEIEVDASGWYTIDILDQASNCLLRDSVEVQLDTLAPILTPGDSLFFACDTDSLLLTVSSNNQDNQRIRWYDQNGRLILNSSWQIYIQNAGTFVFEIENEGNGCISRDSFEVIPDENLPDLSVEPADTLNCIRNSVILSASGQSSGGGIISYIWSKNGNILDSSSVLEVFDGGSYSILITDLNNGCSVSQQVQVAVDREQPEFNILSLDTINCRDTSARIISEILNARNVNYHYNWSQLDGSVIDPDGDSSLTVMNTGTYLLEITNLDNGCSNIEMVEVMGAFDYPEFVILQPSEITCNQDSVLISVLSQNSVSYSWDGPQEYILSPLDSSNIWVSGAGQYRLKITNEHSGCQSDTMIQVHSNLDTLPLIILNHEELDCGNESIDLVFELSSVVNANTTWRNEADSILAQNVRNLTVSSPGIYYAEVINPINGCLSISHFEVIENIDQPQSISFELMQPGCEDSLGILVVENIVGGTAPYTIELSGQQVSMNTPTKLTPGQHTLYVQDGRNCIILDTISIQNSSAFEFYLPELYEIEYGEEVQLSPTLLSNTQITNINWLPSIALTCSNCLEPFASPLVTTNYTLELTNDGGCVRAQNTVVQVNLNPVVYLPNSFSPNEDGRNDRFFPQAIVELVEKVHSMQVFDRWGNQLFVQKDFLPNDASKGWDGTYKDEPMDSGVYVYYLEIEFINGKKEVISGDVALFK